MLLLITVVNGQPFFYHDTSNYVRAPDAAVVWLFGKRFATPWTSPDVIKIFDAPSAGRATEASSTNNNTIKTPEQAAVLDTQDQHTNSLEQGIIIYGRSAYYGALLYLGTVTGGFWLSVFIQALVVSHLIFILAVRCFRLPTSSFALSIAILSFFSTLPFFVGFLMPYIFAAVTILVTGIFLIFWDEIRPSERVVLAIILVFAVLSHDTHLLIAISMLAVYGIALLSYRFRVTYFRLVSFATISTCVLIGILGQIAFGVAVKEITGVSPIRPPLLTARFINLGPGYQYLRTHCDDTSFAVCQFRSRLPVGTDSFIWSPDPAVGVFTPATKDMKRALADEQFSFATKVFAFDPFGILFAMLSVGAHQMTAFSLDVFRNAGSWNHFSDLPTTYWSKMQETLAFKHGWIVDIISTIDYGVVILSSLVLILAVLLFAKQSSSHSLFPQFSSDCASRFLFCTLIGFGVVANALICASFSSVHNHYQARVIWLIPLLALLAITRCYLPRERQL